MLLRKLAYWSTYTVVRWQLLLGLVVVWAIWRWLHITYQSDDSTHWEILEQFLPVAGWIVAYVAAFSALTVLLAWSWFLIRYRSGKMVMRLRIGESNTAEAGAVRISLQTSGVLRPLFGQVQARLVFNDYALSSIITLNQNVHENGGWLRSGISGSTLTDIYNRGNNDVEEIQFLFVDPLRLLVMPFTIPTSRRVNTLPRKSEEMLIPVQPNRTEQQLERIETPKRVEGEMLSYKDFESGDDVRRIVWKIYARSGELVVRIPETMDPYASHLVLYASFYNSISKTNDQVFDEQLLNAYKDIVRQLMDGALKSEYSVRLPADQPMHDLMDEMPEKKLLLQISVSNWQQEQTPVQYVNVRDAAMVCIPSVTPASDVEQLLWQLPPQVPVVIVSLSGSIPTLFQLPASEYFFSRYLNPAEKLRRAWTFAGLRRKLRENEARLELLSVRRGNTQLIKAPKQ